VARTGDEGYKAPRGAGVGKVRGGPWEGARGGRGCRGERARRTRGQASGGAAPACERERVLGRIKFGVPLFERVELQKFE
jgi:hypothetical protein